jgi:PGF-pre-PGF domain-containing protein
MNSKDHQLTEITKLSFQTKVKAKSLVFLILLILLFLCYTCTLTNAAQSNDESTIKITYPSDASFVNIKETAIGTAGNIPEGQKLWILIYPPAANKFYPQHWSVNVISGNWSIPVELGTKYNAGETFKIIAVLADQESNKELTNYINTGNSTGWPGMSSIPVGAQVVDEVTVTRKIEPLVDITSPLNTARMQDTITGTAKYIPEDKSVWILIYPSKAHKYYPQNKANIQKEKWEVSAQFGQENNISEQFEIIAVLADQNAQNEFKAYLDKSNAAQKWDGILTLPKTTQELARVTVIRTGDSLPVADFSINPTSGYAPLSVKFTDNSQKEAWRTWYFGDGDTSNEQNPTHIYRSEGTYNVFLSASNENGTTSKNAWITVKKVDSSNGGSGGSSSGGSSSGGGGAGGSPEPQKNVEVKELSQAYVSSGKSVKFDFTKNATCVVYVGFDSKKSFGKTTTIAEQLKGKSTLVSELPEGEVYKSFNVWVGNGGVATSKNIGNAELCFKVDKNWIKDQKIDQGAIVLNRYIKSSNGWEQILAEIAKEDEKYIYLTAKTLEYGSFAITAKKGNIQGNENKQENDDENTVVYPIHHGQSAEPIGESNSSENGSRLTNINQTVQMKENNSTLPKESEGTPGFEAFLGIICLLAVLFIKDSRER